MFEDSSMSGTAGRGTSDVRMSVFVRLASAGGVARALHAVRCIQIMETVGSGAFNTAGIQADELAKRSRFHIVSGASAASRHQSGRG
jgi:hypothetical protein